MGHVKEEQRNDGKGCAEFLYLPLSDIRVVRVLVEKRSKLDPLYYASMEHTTLDTTSGVYVTGDPVTNTFIDLDRLIELCKFTKSEKSVLDLLMYGYSRRDIAELREVDISTINTLCYRIYNKIIEQNNLLWEKVNCDAPISERKYKYRNL